MVLVNEIKGRMVANGYTQRQLASKMGITPASLINKFKSGIFTTDEAKLLIDLLGIQDPAAIFFAPAVTCGVTKSESQ